MAIMFSDGFDHYGSDARSLLAGTGQTPAGSFLHSHGVRRGAASAAVIEKLRPPDDSDLTGDFTRPPRPVMKQIRAGRYKWDDDFHRIVGFTSLLLFAGEPHSVRVLPRVEVYGFAMAATSATDWDQERAANACEALWRHGYVIPQAARRIAANHRASKEEGS